MRPHHAVFLFHAFRSELHHNIHNTWSFPPNTSALFPHQAKLESGQPASITVEGQTLSITPSMVSIKKEMTRVTGRSFTPAVIEPSFGIGRIM